MHSTEKKKQHQQYKTNPKQTNHHTFQEMLREGNTESKLPVHLL